MSKRKSVAAEKYIKEHLAGAIERQNMKAAATAKEILAGLANQKLEAQGKPVLPTPAGFYGLWVQHISLNYDDMPCIAPFTMAEKKQAKDMIELWGAGALEPVLSLVLAEWIEFTKAVESQAGAFKSPLRPTFRYLFMYRAHAKNYWSSRSGAKPMVQSTPKKIIVKSNYQSVEDVKPTPPSEPLQSIAIKPKEEQATLEEVQAIIAAMHSFKKT